MLRLSKLADYAVVILSNMACDVQSLQPTSALARKTKIPEPTVAKLLKQLVKAGILTSVRGISGGYRLAQPPNDVTLDRIVEAIDGPIRLTCCAEDGGAHCSISENCPVRRQWMPVNRALKDALARVNLSGLVERERTDA